MQAIRMLEDAEGSPNGHTVYRYVAGEIYTRDSEPPVDEHLMTSFVGNGRAVEVDAAGNPIGKPADRRATKAAEDAARAAALGTPDDEGANSQLEQRLRRR